MTKFKNQSGFTLIPVLLVLLILPLALATGFIGSTKLKGAPVQTPTTKEPVSVLGSTTCIAQDIEPNATTVQANTLGRLCNPSVVTGTIGLQQGDVKDVYLVSIFEQAVYNFSLLSAAGDTTPPATLRVMTPTGQFVGSANIVDGKAHLRVTLTGGPKAGYYPTANNYYVLVDSPKGIINYELQYGLANPSFESTTQSKDPYLDGWMKINLSTATSFSCLQYGPCNAHYTRYLGLNDIKQDNATGYLESDWITLDSSPAGKQIKVSFYAKAQNGQVYSLEPLVLESVSGPSVGFGTIRLDNKNLISWGRYEKILTFPNVAYSNNKIRVKLMPVKSDNAWELPTYFDGIKLESVN